MPNIVELNPPRYTDYVGHFPLLNKILTGSRDLVYIVEKGSSIPLYANYSLLQLLGYNDKQIDDMGKEWGKYVTHPDDYEHLNNHIQRYSFLNDKNISRVIYRMRDANDSWHIFETLAINLPSAKKDSVDAIIGVTRDITHSVATNTADNLNDHDVRCKNCSKLLGIEHIKDTELEIKCVRCGEFNSLTMVG